MKLLYTSSQTPNTIQASPLSSLGGYCSNSPVPNDFLDNVFDYISRYSENEKADQYRCIVFNNDTNDPMENLEMWVADDTTTPNSVLLLASMEMLANGRVELISSPFSRPFSVPEFYPSSVDNKLLIASTLLPNEKIAIWIQRQILGQGNLFEGTPSEVKAKILAQGKIERKVLNFSWD